jgi:hypothetical protein
MLPTAIIGSGYLFAWAYRREYYEVKDAFSEMERARERDVNDRAINHEGERE